MKPSLSFSEKKQVDSEDKVLNQSCHCTECGGKIHKKLLSKQDDDHFPLDKIIKIKHLELDKTPSNLEILLRSSGNPSIHTPMNVSKIRAKFKPMTHILQMVHVKSVLSKLVNSQPIKQQQQMYQSSPQTLSDFTSKIQGLKISELKEIQSPFIGQRLKTEPILQNQQQQLQIDTVLVKQSFINKKRYKNFTIQKSFIIQESLEQAKLELQVFQIHQKQQIKNPSINQLLQLWRDVQKLLNNYYY